MQQSPLTLRQRLIDAVDESYHVKDLDAIDDVLDKLERLPVTKELLEQTRLGKTVNEFRKKIDNEKLAKRAKALVKKWRDAVLTLPPAPNTDHHHPPQSMIRPLNGNSLDSTNFGAYGPLRSGYSSNSSSPKLMPSNKISPNAIHNSNSLSPRILSNLTTNNNNNNNNISRNNGQQNRVISSTLSSPALSSSSPSLRPNSAKTLFGQITSPQVNNKTLSNSYAPNTEVVARTNAANKRLRIEDGLPVVGPPTKKAKGMPNGGIDVSLGESSSSFAIDELSKDSFHSRGSDQSDGYSSKPVSNISSGAALSAAPSPLSVTPQDSNLTPPPSVGVSTGAESSGALINQEDVKPSFPIIKMETEASAAIIGAIDDPSPLQLLQQQQQQPAVETAVKVETVVKVQPAPKRGRRRKEIPIMDTTTLIRHQIAQAQQENKLRTVQRLSMENFDDEQSRSSDLAQEYYRKVQQSQSAALKSEGPVMKSEIVEKYLQSQTELRTKMERQVQDAVKRNEIPIIVDEPPPAPATSEDSKKKKKRKKNKDSSVENVIIFPSESEILARLPPIDPKILEELKNFQFYVEPETEDNQAPKSENETDNVASLITSENTANKPETAKEDFTIGGKIDWGDSDGDDDEKDYQVPPHIKTETPVTAISLGEDQVDDASVVATPSQQLPQVSLSTDEVLMDIVGDDELLQPPKEIDDSDVERLHLEHVENLNGTRDKDGEFKEWHEVVTVKSFHEDILHILPYTIIDF